MNRTEGQRAVRQLITVSMAAGGFIFGSIQVLGAFGLVQPGDLGGVGLAACLASSVAVGAIYALVRLIHRSNRRQADPPPSSPGEAILQTMSLLKKEGEHRPVVALGMAVFRSQCVKGQWLLLIRMGNYVKDAALLVEDEKARLCALVDMIGWPSVVLGDSQQGQLSFEEAIKPPVTPPARDAQCHYLVAKAKRHLAGIAYKGMRLDEAEDHLRGVQDYADLICDAKLRQEMLAGIEYGWAEVFRLRNDYEQAIQHSMSSRTMYEALGDDLRVIKVITQQGYIHLNQHDYVTAKIRFTHALDKAIKYSRPEQLAAANHGLGKVLLAELKGATETTREGIRDEASSSLTQALKMYEKLHMHVEAGLVKADVLRLWQDGRNGRH